MPKHGSITSLRPRKPEGSLGRTAQDVHLDSHTAPELCVWRWGEEGDYIPIATLSPPEWLLLKRAAMRAILMFYWLWGTKSQDSVHKPQPLWAEGRAEAESSRGPSAYQPNALPLGQTGSRMYDRLPQLDGF